MISENKPTDIPRIAYYESHLHSTAQWLLRSIEHGGGGSCAHFSPFLGWSKPYPETTGYLIPTLFQLQDYFGDDAYADKALLLGEWLLSLQNHDGSWNGGLYGAKNSAPSVFNTGQILKGMIALHRRDDQQKWLKSAQAGAAWLALQVSADGLWPSGDYQSNVTPSYYAHVAWPMLEVWSESGDERVKQAAQRFLNTVLNRIQAGGVIDLWGFREEAPAFTHTIGYTIRGLQESARLLDDAERYAQPLEKTLDILYRKSELRAGKLPGMIDAQWNPASKSICLTGNAQIAICFLLLDATSTDLRLVNAACKLLDVVCKTQCLRLPLKGIQGGVAGSFPLMGKYMIGRYPNWAAKYHCDALMALIKRLRAELVGIPKIS